MCLTMPARVITVDGDWAEVEVGDLRRRASTLPVPEVRPGDWALLSAGTLVRIVKPDIAEQIRAAVGLATTDDAPSAQGETT
ncbi:MAG TPA: HypC/HybG/HupF family hydrogenase formation chaperone [Candidatus Limnocylindria bacterium]|jgi:hydrogenase assembly chaperone HypC/HupF